MRARPLPAQGGADECALCAALAIPGRERGGVGTPPRRITWGGIRTWSSAVASVACKACPASSALRGRGQRRHRVRWPARRALPGPEHRNILLPVRAGRLPGPGRSRRVRLRPSGALPGRAPLRRRLASTALREYFKVRDQRRDRGGGCDQGRFQGDGAKTVCRHDPQGTSRIRSTIKLRGPLSNHHSFQDELDAERPSSVQPRSTHLRSDRCNACGAYCAACPR